MIIVHDASDVYNDVSDIYNDASIQRSYVRIIRKVPMNSKNDHRFQRFIHREENSLWIHTSVDWD